MAMPEKPPEEKKVRVTLTLDPQLVERLDTLARIAEVSRSKMTQNMVEIGLDVAEGLESFRLLSLGALIRSRRKEFKEKMREMILRFERNDRN